MSNEIDAATESSRPLISLPFIVIVAVLGVGGYIAGPYIMQWVFLQQEAQKSNTIDKPEEFAGLSELAKSLQEDPNAEWVGGTIGGGGGGGERPDPAARFASMDADEDGKLTGDEIQGRLKENMERFDANGDGEITEEEFLTAIRNRGGSRGRPASDSGEESAAPAEKEETSQEPAAESDDQGDA